MKKIAFIFPGQGSQKLQMGKDFYDNFEESKEVFEKANQVLGFSLTDIIFNGPKDKLDLTLYSQLGIFVVSVAILKALEKIYPDILPTVCAGLSLGEYSALFASKKLDFENLLKLIEKRANFMTQACLEQKGSMAAVLGLDYIKVKSLIENIDNLWIANVNTPKQIVISGSLDGIKEAEKILKFEKAKVILLDVQGAFHSPFMEKAKINLEKEILKLDFLNSDIRICQNVTADFEIDKQKIKTNLINQVTKSVLWAFSIENMEKEIDLFIEIGPGKTLTNMNKKMLKKAKFLSVEKIEDLKELKDAP